MSFINNFMQKRSLMVFMLLMVCCFTSTNFVHADITTGLVAFYPFNGNANDASGNGHNGTVNGAALTTDRFNNQNSAYSFDGVDDYISIPNHSDFNMTGDYAFSLWIYQKNAITNGSYRILDKATGGTCNGWNLDTYDGSTGRRIRLDVSCPWIISTSPHSLNAWHHVVASVHAQYVTFYLDGHIDGGGSVAATPTNGLNVYIGAPHPSSGSFDGFIDDVRIYNRALTDAEVQTLYGGDNFTLNFPGSGSGTVTGDGFRNGSAASFTTNIGTTEQFDMGTILQLHGEPFDYNIFTGWSGDCAGKTDCNLTMTASRNVNAIFDFYTDHKTRVGNTSFYYTSLQAAYDNAPDPGTIKAWATDYVENLNCNQAKNITVEGGYNEGYTNNTGNYSTLLGNLTIMNGSLTCDKLIISACNGSCSYYTISGKITYNGTGLGGVSVRLSGASASLITTDSNGNYTFTGLSNGTYTVTPALAGYTITPQQATINSANVTLNFAASPITYSITGRITYNSSGLSGVAVALTGTSTANTTTDSNGNYSFTGLTNGTYTVTPTLAGYTITPQQITVNGANVTTNFTATLTGYSISGRVTCNSTGLSGVAVALTGSGTAYTTTDSNGDYSFTGLANGSYTITPSLTGYSLTPANLSATVSNASVTGKNFTATLNPATMPTPRAKHAQVTLQNGNVLITGGFSSSTFPAAALDTAVLFDPTTNTFSAVAGKMNSTRTSHTATLLPNGKVLLTGGQTTDNDGDGSNTAELYDPSTQSFTARPGTMTSHRGGHAAVLLNNGTVLIMGGYWNSSTAQRSAEIYNPATDTFTALGSLMVSPRSELTANLLPNGKVLVAGGESNHIGTNSAEIYDPATGTFTAIPATMTSIRYTHSASPLPNGHILLSGGVSSLTPPLSVYDTVEDYNPSTQIFTTVSKKMTSPRFGHASSLLADGSVFITGGASSFNGTVVNVLSSVERFVP